ncbi:hypothetical protein QYE76_030924 [Lolium multiflorum]|uniref:Reverse transcriptase Ty1/copia-type domain-containing protein n=1 Tax=Lolium multiflorum TaxID=4521 RepID=A0AAD8VJ89_LOLMU|nr:hypothetical protein QYE76_030924 [Lolium multiflorum]
MLKAAEIEIKKEHQVLMVNKTTSFKKQGKSKGKFKKGGKKAATPPVKPKSGPKPDAECYYKEKGHWKRNCSKYLADLKSGLVKKKKEEMRNTFTIDTAGNTTTKRVAQYRKMFLYHLHRQQRKLMIMIMKLQMRQLLNLRSTRDRATPDWYDPCLNVMIVDNNDEDPATYEEAMMSPDSNKWQEAMKSEMGSMYDNKVWTLVDLPDSRKAVENKWIFKRKTDADGNITVYKARLVAKGFRKIQGVDYDETFSPVAKLKSVRILLAIAAFFDYEIWQMDVKTAFLNGDIEEELYMEACRKDVERAFGVLQAQFAIVRYPALSWSHDQMWEVMQTCVIMHNMIIEDDRKNHARTHVGPYECEGPLAEVDHELPADFADFLAMHAKIRDSNVHDQLQADLVEHLWRIKGLSANAATP